MATRRIRFGPTLHGTRSKTCGVFARCTVLRPGLKLALGTAIAHTSASRAQLQALLGAATCHARPAARFARRAVIRPGQKLALGAAVNATPTSRAHPQALFGASTRMTRHEPARFGWTLDNIICRSCPVGDLIDLGGGFWTSGCRCCSGFLGVTFLVFLVFLAFWESEDVVSGRMLMFIRPCLTTI